MPRAETIHVVEQLGHGDGDFFLTDAGVTVTDYNDRVHFKHKGATQGGFKFGLKDADLDIEGGTPETLLKNVITKMGAELEVNFAEALSVDQFYAALGYGTLSTDALNASETITNCEFTLYGNNKEKLPYHHLTITSISDTEATPNSYTGADITTNFEIDLTNGYIRAKTSAESGTLTPATYGTSYVFTGTWAKPKQQILAASQNMNEEKNYHSLLFLVNMGSNRTKGYFFPKCYAYALSGMDHKSGTVRILGVKFKTALHPSMSELWYAIDETL
jgi:hypothetical protein